MFNLIIVIDRKKSLWRVNRNHEYYPIVTSPLLSFPLLSSPLLSSPFMSCHVWSFPVHLYHVWSSPVNLYHVYLLYEEFKICKFLNTRITSHQALLSISSTSFYWQHLKKCPSRHVSTEFDTAEADTSRVRHSKACHNRGRAWGAILSSRFQHMSSWVLSILLSVL